MYNKKGEIDQILDESAQALEIKKVLDARGPPREPKNWWEKIYGVEEDLPFAEDAAKAHRDELLSLFLAYGIIVATLKYLFDSGIIHP
jgi:hypothetical protein